MPKLLLADRIKDRQTTFLAPLIPALERYYDVRFISTGPGEALAEAVAWADIVWLEWCWDHAVWVTNSGCLTGKRCIVRLHSIEALQTNFPARMDWSHVDQLITVGEDIAEVLLGNNPAIAERHRPHIIPNGIDLDLFLPGRGDRFQIAWVGHLEPKKNPMLLLQIAHALHRLDPRYRIRVAGGFTDLRTARYTRRLMSSLGLGGVVRFDGTVADMPSWYADKGVLLSTSMYESFGLNIAEAMAVGAFPVVHDFPGADRLWPEECLFASIEQAIALIRSARPGLYREWIRDRYSLDRTDYRCTGCVGWTAMMRVIAIGRARDGPEADLFERYRIRIRPELTLTELPDGKGAVAEIKRREAEAILAALPGQAFSVALDLAGEALDTPTFAVRLDRWLNLSRPIQFLIGGAEGLDRTVLTRADFVLSLGRMTWPHLLARAMLAEQIYRARSIAAGHPYHRTGRPD